MSTASFNARTTAEVAARALASSIKGRNVLVTGVTPGGLGAETARVIAKEGASLVVLAGRKADVIGKTKASILAESRSANLRSLVVDLSSFASVRTAAQDVLSYAETLDVIINNAGIMAVTPYTLSPDGIELQFATNHLGHFLLTNLIRPRLSPSVRVVNVSSNGHTLSPIRFTDHNFSAGSAYNEWQAYGQAKTANVLFSVSLAERWGIEAFSLHPGEIWTNLPAQMTKEEMLAVKFINEEGNPSDKYNWKTLGEGAATAIVAAFDPTLKDHNASYLVDCQPSRDGVESYAIDKDNAEKLWKLSEKLVGEKFRVEAVVHD